MRRKTTTLCVIARNEEATIGTAVKSVLALVDEMILVDTGSTDNTRIIAEGYGARVLDVPWEEDFAQARNAALAEATGDWILILDADEFLEPIRPVEFQRLLHDPAAAGYRLRVSGSRDGGAPVDTCSLRLFRNHEGVRYRYPIHERIEPALEHWARQEGLNILEAPLTVIHDAQRVERQNQARERNLRILRRALAERPHEPYFSYRLACESIVELDGEVLPVVGLKKALGFLHQAWTRVEILDAEELRDLSWAPDLGAKICSALLAVDKVDQARAVARRLEAVFPDSGVIALQAVAADIRYLAGHAAELPGAVTGELTQLVRRKLEKLRSRAQDRVEVGRTPEIPAHYILRCHGDLSLAEGRVADAVGSYEQALSLDPTYSFGWLGMAECSRFAGDRKRALKLYLRTITESDLNHRAWLRGCDLMRQMDFQDNAESWWRQVSTLFPEHPEVVRQLARENESAALTP